MHQTINGLRPLGIGSFTIHRFNSETVSNRHLYGQAADFELLVGFAEHNGLVFEIMQPVNGTDSLMAAWLEANGNQAGVQHIAFDMGDLPMDRRIAQMKERGFEVAMEGVWKGKQGQCRFTFFDTLLKGAGTCFETIEFSDDWEEPEGEICPNVEEESTNGKQ
ncbi:hypothetical protein LTR70_007607 [Exophiala xenobiotica]|uniref:VOC domain-containing protein n=1 Tax=Lithohypha guttulata TaxID=1690604 RepID=A0ABR0JUK8_9EURO|nr:hypothetical protein LTR24_010472 [Lithohypha guttulata]KAK5313498.1 hypothetical protein LTR70_007607 [Exophiala xenobiotica]